MGNIPLLAGSIVGGVILQFLLLAIYNIFFHPCRKFPGPKIAAATGIFYHYKCLKGEEAAWETEMHKRYGEVVRLAPDRLSFVTAGAWRDIAGPSVGKRLENRKDPTALPSNIRGMRSLASEYRTEVHRPRRRLYQNAFSDKALRKQEPLILGYVNLLVQVIKEAATKDSVSKVDIQKLLNCCTFDVMADLTFGEPLGLLEKSELSPWVAQIFGNVKNTSIKRLALEYPIIERLIKIMTPKSLTAAGLAHYDYSAQRVKKRLAKGIDIGKPDIWSLVMTKNEQGEMPEEIMMADATTFMIAGTETTASTLSALFYLCLTHPEQMQRLQAEVRTLREDELTLDTMQHLPFMSACIKESLRVHPVVPIPLFRKTPQGGNVIDGQWIPENTRVAVSQYAAYHHNTNFKNPDSFLPERWLPGTGYDADHKDAFNPFSIGPRNCIGQNLANHEMRIILAKLVWNFDFELCDESRSWIQQKVYMLWDKPPLIVKARNIRA
ncbi:hypothetical protein COCVIDRAFT_37744 [Bipolaris victoriae FI3]|uniref:Cytochrome P450 monooxygenase n=1 Tax=Bipolaris victoriae (strain FI3) TaxID=930091 RepID=W7EFN5_BIPV3|nr:hypothetical protein COCVIDRAFT_37744 [Bipolaris victoriae FI3]